MDEAQPRASTPRWLIVVVAIAVVAGIFFRFYHLDRKVFWDDEVMGTVHMLGYTEASVVEASRQFTTAADVQRYLHPPRTLRLADTVRALAAEDPQHPPAYYLLERLWVQAFGSTPAIYRSLSAVFGVLLLICVYWLGAELFGSPLPALLTVALVAVSPLYVLYAQEAREYMLWLCAIAVDGALFLRASRTSSVLLWIAYTLVTAVALYIFPLTGLVALGFTVYLLFRERFRPTRALIGCVLGNVVALAAFVPWLRVALASHGLLSGMSGIATRKLTAAAFVTTALRDLRFPFVDAGLFRAGPVGSTLVNLVLSVLVVVLLVVALRALIRDRPFAIWGFIVIGLCVFLAPLGAKGQFLIQTRYFFPLLLGLQLAVAALLAGLIFVRETGPARAPRTGIALLLVLLVAEAGSCGIAARAETLWTKDYQNSRAVAAAIARSPKAVLVSDSFAARTLALSLYLDPKTPVRVDLHCEQCTVQPAPRPDLMNTTDYDTVFYLQIPVATNTGNVRWIDPRPYPPRPDPLNLFLYV